MARLHIALVSLALLGSAACTQEPAASSRPSPASRATSGYALVDAFPGQAKFELPVYLDWHASDPEHYYVVQQRGTVLRIPRDGSKADRSVFLDWRRQTHTAHMEEGLLGFAFDPEHATNGAFYIYWSHGLGGGKRETLITRFQSKDHVAVAHASTFVLRIPQPFGNHKGGTIVFGPDQMLYVAVGDGGSANDPHKNGQSKKTLLGKILRIDVRAASAKKGYTVPPDNPFVGDAEALPEIWAYGLRNPWRISFDRATGDLWCADVGQDQWEEVDKIKKGGNYGWSFYEGTHAFPPGSMRDPNIDHVPPIAEYSHKDGQSATGGYVYRGTKIKALVGAYVYADWLSGKVWCAREADAEQGRRGGTLLFESGKSVASFAEEPDGELLLLCFDGRIYRLTG